MPQKYLQLEDTRVYYDQETGAIRLISKDPRLNGSPFQLNLLRDSDSTESIYRLLEAEDLLGETPRELPRLTYLPSIGLRLRRINEDLRFPNHDIKGKNLRFLLGETYDDSFLEINLHSAPSTLIGGAPGTGKSVLLRSLMEQALEKSELTLCHIDVHTPEDASSVHSRFRFQDKLATDPTDALELVRSMAQEQSRRYAQMEAAGVNSWLDLPNTNAIFFALEEYSALLRACESNRLEIEEVIGLIARRGRAAGIYLAICSAWPTAPDLPGEFKANLGRRILMGSGNRELQEMTLGTPLRYGERSLDPVGRGVVKVYGAPIRTFQGFAQR